MSTTSRRWAAGAAIVLVGCGDGAVESTAGGIATVVALVPTSDVASRGVTGEPDAALYRDLDDGTSLLAADDATSLVRSQSGQRTGVVEVGYSGAPAGRVTDVVVRLRARRATARKGNVRVNLEAAGVRIGTGSPHGLGSSWTNVTESFHGLSAASAGDLTTEVILENTSPKARGTLQVTQVFVEVTIATCDAASCDDGDPCTADSCDPAQGCRHEPLDCGGEPDAGPPASDDFLAEDRRIDWSRAGVPDGIPARTTVCATLGTPGGDRSTRQTVTRTQINDAIARCPDDQVVFLNPGTYDLTGDPNNGDGILLMRSRVTLRGAGPDQTLLRFSGSADERIRIGQSPWDPPAPVTVLGWIAGYDKGTTQLTLDGPVPASQVGGIICFDQLYDGVDVRLVGASGRQSPSWLSRDGNRPLQQCAIATAVDGNTVTISPGLSSPYWRASQAPQLWFMPKSSQVHFSGVEDLAVDPASSGGEDTIHFNNTYACWIRNVETMHMQRRAIVIRHSLNAEVRDSFIHGHTNDCTDGGAIEVGRRAVSDVLLENNIFYDVAAALYNEAASGNVVAYNYGVYFPYCVSGWLAETLNTHGAHPNMILIEGNQISQFVADDVYDPTSHITIFRNRFSGYDEGKTGGTVAISFVRWSDYFAAVGNVLGTPGFHDQYDERLTGSGGGQSIFSFLYFDGFPRGLLRGGNYDTVSGRVIWSDDAPAGDSSTYLPPQTLPASLYYGHGARPERPRWWNSPTLPNPNLPWPAIGPDVTGGDPSLGGHAHDIPAKQCFDMLRLASGGLYDADRCYGATTP